MAKRIHDMTTKEAEAHRLKARTLYRARIQKKKNLIDKLNKEKV